MKAYASRKQNEIETQRALNFELARLVAFAFHDPKKMPEYKAASKADDKKSSEVNDAKVSAFFRALAERANQASTKP